MSMDESQRAAFKTIGVSPVMTAGEAKRFYFDLLKKWHPDKFLQGSKSWEKANDKCKNINAAWIIVERYLVANPPPKADRAVKDNAHVDPYDPRTYWEREAFIKAEYEIKRARAEREQLAARKREEASRQRKLKEEHERIANELAVERITVSIGNNQIQIVILSVIFAFVVGASITKYSFFVSLVGIIFPAVPILITVIILANIERRVSNIKRLQGLLSERRSVTDK